VSLRINNHHHHALLEQAYTDTTTQPTQPSNILDLQFRLTIVGIAIPDRDDVLGEADRNHCSANLFANLELVRNNRNHLLNQPTNEPTNQSINQPSNKQYYA
jgi:hypothetical protein